VPCCAWGVTGGAAFYILLLWLFVAWTTAVAFALRQFVVGGAIGAWYFAPAASSSVGAAAPGAAEAAAVKRSIRHALGPQFGTIVFGGAVLTLVDLLRSAMRSAAANQRSAVAAVACGIMNCVAQGALLVLESLTKFAVVWAALRGGGFLESGRAVTDLFKRHALDSLRVWWFPQLVVFATSLALSLLWVCVTFPFVLASVGGDANYPSAAGIATFAFFSAFAVLQLAGSLLLNVVDAAYVCWAVDRDAGAGAGAAAARPDIDALFAVLPVHTSGSSAGLLVEQPGGGVSYAPSHAAGGAPAAGAAPAAAEEGRAAVAAPLAYGGPADPPPPPYASVKL